MRSPARALGGATVEARALVAVYLGSAVAAAGFIGGWLDGSDWWVYALTIWIVSAPTYVVWTWLVVARMDGKDTKSHAKEEDPVHFATVISVVIASVFSLVAVGFLLRSDTGLSPLTAAGLGTASVVAAWFAVHTVFTLHYARLYYRGSKADIDFNDKPGTARYSDFAYLSFTIGMSYAVSDASLHDYVERRTVLWHALVSYLLGAVILAVTINLVAGLEF